MIMYDIFYVSKSIIPSDDWKILKSKYPTAQRIENVSSFSQIRDRAFTKMFWVIWDDVNLLDSFNLIDYRATQWDNMYVHVFKNGEHFDGVCLFPKSLDISNREFYHRFFTNKKEIDIQASIPKKYNIYFPNTYEEYKDITDDMFWIVWPEVEVIDTTVFDLYFSHHNSYDRRENHVFKNLCNDIQSFQSGIILCSKFKQLSKKEFDNQYAVDKKEYNTVVSRFSYPVYKIESYEEYLEICKNEKQKMFWVIWPEIEIIDDTIFDFSFDFYNDYDKTQNHVFKNLSNDVESYLNGLVLFSTSAIISKKEFTRRYLIEKKEHNRVVSRNRYPRYYINTYTEYLEICKNEKQKMFWVIWPEIKIIDDKIFDLYFDPNDGKYDHDRSENHVFKNLCNDVESYLSGVVLCSPSAIISKKEFTRRYLIDKKEHNTIVSRFSYPVYKIESYKEYLEICKNEQQKMFWVVWPEIEIIDDKIFNLYFDPNDGRYDYDRSENHVFKNLFNTEETYTNGIVLCSRDVVISEKEFTHRFIIKKKEHPQIASKMKPYEVIFISYNELFADNNYSKLLIKQPNAKRISGIKGIHQAHAAAAKLSTTSMFWIVDADAEIVDNFEFNFTVSEYNRDQVYVWKSKNPINDLEYGYGGVKLFPKKLALEMNINSVDMTTSISKKFNVVDEISNITSFNTDPFSTWKSAFRECVKLSSKLIDGQIDDETSHRLDVWCSVGADKKYGLFSIAGAIAGKHYGQTHKHDVDALRMINDFDWLRMMFDNQSIAN